MSSSPYFLLCLKISSERWKRERDELLPLLLQSKKRRRSFPEEEEEKACRKENNAKKAGGGGGLLLVLPPPPPPEDLLLDLNEEPNPLWEEMKAAGKARVVFKRRLSESDVRRSLARCILNRREM